MMAKRLRLAPLPRHEARSLASFPHQARGASGTGMPMTGFFRPHPRERRRHEARDLPETGMNEGIEIMSGYLNEATLIGNLGQNPEIRNTQSGGRIATLSIATSESWKDKRSGERQERTEWHRVVIFNEALCDIVEKYLEKGAKVYIQGQIRTRKWQDQSGADRYSTEIHITTFNGQIIFLSNKKNGERKAGADNDATRERAAAGGDYDVDDDIPF